MSAKKKITVEKQVSNLIKDAVDRNASDLHLEIFENGGRARMRLDGMLRNVAEFDTKTYFEIVEKVKAMSALCLEEKRLPQDGRIILDVGGERVDLRVSATPCCFGENLTLRMLRKSQLCIDLKRAGLNPEQSETLASWYNSPNGVVLVTGPTGSGKTTVLYMILNELNKETRKVCSIEDPIEYAFEGICQMAVNPKIGITFPRAMRSILRSDPDVIMVGEIRDLDTAQCIVQMSLTGHLVLSTLHTNTATEGVVRLRDIGLDPFLIKDTLRGITSQRLLRKLCPDCRKEYSPDKITLDHLKLKKQKFFKAVGCKKCNHTGYKGRMAIFEFFEMSNAAKELLMRNCTPEELRKQAIVDGMQTIFQSGVEKAIAGETSLDEVLRVVGNLRD